MKNTDNKYNKIINHIKETEPVLQNKELLTVEIMSKIKDRQDISRERPNIFIPFIRPVMTAAAVFLIALFLFQQKEIADKEPINTLSYNFEQDNNAFPIQSTAIENKLSKELEICLKESKDPSITMDPKCVAKLLLMYKKVKMRETPTYKQKIKNWLNH